MFGCPPCSSVAGNQSTNCYYRDYVTNRCVNPPLANCSIPSTYGTPFELANNYGSCVASCATGFFAVASLAKCTNDCTQFGLLFYSDVPANSTMGSCVSICPNSLIIDPSTHWCVSICPPNSYLKLENRSSTPTCATSCPTGFEYDFNSSCVLICPLGYFAQTLNGHNKCVDVCLGAFGDNTTRVCVNQCPNTSIADPTTHLCVAECPQSYILQVALSNGNRTCVTQC